jgi:uncharacterized protein
MKIPKLNIPNSKWVLKLVILFSFFLHSNSAISQYTIPKVPAEQTSVYDYADVLQPDEEAQLKEKLIRYSDSTTTQIVVITIESLQGEDIGILTPKWGHAGELVAVNKTTMVLSFCWPKKNAKYGFRPVMD